MRTLLIPAVSVLWCYRITFNIGTVLCFFTTIYVTYRLQESLTFPDSIINENIPVVSDNKNAVTEINSETKDCNSGAGRNTGDIIYEWITYFIFRVLDFFR